MAQADPILDWALAEGVRLAPQLDGAADDLGPLARLDPAIDGADLVFLGEMDHFVHEKSDYRLLLCRYLLSRGWRSFAEELSWSDGLRVQRYMADGQGLERLSLFGYDRDLREDRDDRPTGIFRASFDVYPTALMTAEQGRFYRGLRAAAEGEPLAYHGLDIDGLPGGGYADVSGVLGDDSAFLAALARVPGETTREEAVRLALLIDRVPPNAPPQIEVSLRAMAESLAYVEMTYPAKTYQATAPGMAFREGCMKSRFDDVRRLTDKAPTVVMGHALHLAKDDRLLGKAVGVGPGGGLECSLGHHLVQTLGLRTVSIWLVHGAGEDSQPFPDLPTRFDYPRETLNRRLAPLAVPTLVPITGAPVGVFDQPIGVGHMYNVVQPCVLAGQVDAIVYLPRVTPMRL
jgi:erythromycin esterase-like protein